MPVLVDPDSAFGPLHALPAIHDVALVDDHVSVELEPDGTEVGLAFRVTVGGGIENVRLPRMNDCGQLREYEFVTDA